MLSTISSRLGRIIVLTPFGDGSYLLNDYYCKSMELSPAQSPIAFRRLTAQVIDYADPTCIHEQMALAILRGDTAAAYALADDLIESVQRPDGFVSRADLLAQIASLESERDIRALNDIPF